MEFAKVMITPKLAKEYLEKMPTNRNIKPGRILRYANDLTSGRWVVDSGETIKFTKDGNLIDGQNRLMAIIRANTPAKMWVAKGVDQQAFKVIDTGCGRTASDSFRIAGVKNSGLISQVIAVYMMIKSGNASAKEAHRLPTASVLLEEYNTRPDYWQSVCSPIGHLYKTFGKVLSPAIIGGLYTVLSEINKSQAINFMTQLCTGIDISNNTIAWLRTRMINNELAAAKLPRPIKMALVIKAWNCFRDGTVSKYLKFNPEKEQYPIPV